MKSLLLARGFQWIVLSIGLSSGLAHSDQLWRPSRPEELPANTAPDPFVRVRGARLAYVNYEALRRDFPWLTALSEARIDAWVLDHFAFVSREQLWLDGIRQTPIPIESGEPELTAYRPPSYNRAAVLIAPAPASYGPGLIDVKGNGLARSGTSKFSTEHQIARFEEAQGDRARLNDLRTSDHSDGLMSLGEAIAELTRQSAAQRLFEEHNARHGTRLQTIESYFIIALPFEILKRQSEPALPAALYGRQAHVGRSNGYDVSPDLYVDPQGLLQSDKFQAAVDWGGVIIRDPRLQSNFGPLPGGNPRDATHTRAWAWAHETARAFSKGDARVVYRHLNEMLAPIDAEWRPLHAQATRALQAARATMQRLAQAPYGSTAYFEELLNLSAFGATAQRYALAQGYALPLKRDLQITLLNWLNARPLDFNFNNPLVRHVALQSSVEDANVQLALARILAGPHDELRETALRALSGARTLVNAVEHELFEGLGDLNHLQRMWDTLVFAGVRQDPRLDEAAVRAALQLRAYKQAGADIPWNADAVMHASFYLPFLKRAAATSTVRALIEANIPLSRTWEQPEPTPARCAQAALRKLTTDL